MAKKLVRQPTRIAAAPSEISAFFLCDPITKTRFLVDTGAARSLLPASQWKKPNQQQPNFRLTAANGTPIPTHGQQHLDIRIGNRKYGWNFIVADVTLPLLGADFLAHYQLLVDIARGRLVDSGSLAAIPIAAAPEKLALQVIDVSDDFAQLRNSYPDVFKPELRQQPQIPAKHGIYHHIKTSGSPVYSRFRRLSPDKLASAKQTFAELERLGICQKAPSP